MIPHVVLCLACQRERMAYKNLLSKSYIVMQSVLYYGYMVMLTILACLLPHIHVPDHESLH